ncbi:MAG: tetratricopeptide repeat protein [Gallionella sp.]
MNNSKTPTPADLNQLVALYNNRHYAELENMAGAMVKRFPASGFVWKLLGAAQQMQGKNALEAFGKTAKLLSKEPDAHFNLGVAQKSLGLFNEAAVSYRRALKLNPKYAEAYDNLGNVLKELNQFDEAVASYMSALQIKPGSAITHNNLGTALKELGKFDAASNSFRQALKLKSNYVEAYNNLGNTLKEHGQFDEAITNYHHALRIKPDLSATHNNLGSALNEQGQHEAAITSFHKALQLKPDYAQAYSNLGSAHKELGQFDLAITSFQHALDIKPDFAEVHGNMGSTLKDLGKIDEAISYYLRSLALKPDFALQSSLLFILSYIGSNTPAYRLEEARKYGRMASDLVKAKYSTWQTDPSPQCLRVGIVSGDLRNHPVGYFLESMLPHIDRKRIELFAYPTNIKCDELTARIKPHFSKWCELSSLDDATAAQSIRADGIHVLLDLAGHSKYSRLPMFAWKPAPVQAMWLGYFATTGVAEMDYVLGDHIVMPESEAHHFIEKRWHLDGAISCMTPPAEATPIAALPALTNQYITFGTLNNLAKMNDRVVACWARILNAVPDSRLYMNTGALRDQEFRDNIVARYAVHGISESRLIMEATTGRTNALASYNKFDIALDPFPYPGWTTTYEALWMGVPTLTMRGDAYISHLGESIMHHGGLPDWVTDDEEGYVAKAVAFASDSDQLATLRAGLRDQVLTSPLFDAPRFARSFEVTLWGMWQARCQ